MRANGIGAVLVACAMGACGAEGADVAAPPTRVAEPPAPRVRVDAAVPPVPDVEVEALFAAFAAAETADEHKAIERLVAAGEPALDRVWLALFCSSQEESWHAERAVVRFGPAAIARLLAELRSPDVDRRMTVVLLLERMAADWAHGVQGPEVCRALLGLLDDVSYGGEAERALAQSRPAGSVLAADLARLWQTGTSARALDVLLALGPDARDAVPLVREEAFGGQPADGDRRLDALRILESVGANDPEFVAPLVALLDFDSEAVRVMALRLLALQREIDAPLAARLGSLLGDGAVSLAASLVLAKTPLEDEPTFRAFVAYGDVDALRSRMAEPAFRARVFQALPQMEPGEPERLLSILMDGNVPFDAGAFAVAMTRHPAAECRREAVLPWVLDRELPIARDVAAFLLASEDADVRISAAQVLSMRPGDDPGTLLPTLLALCLDADEDRARWAASALGDFASRDQKALAALLKLGAPARGLAARSVESAPPGSSAIRPLLVAALDDPDEAVRRCAARCLATGGIEPALSAKIVPLLARDATEGRLLDALVAALLAAEEGPQALAREVELRLEQPEALPRGFTVIAAMVAPRFASVRDALLRRRAAATDDAERKAIDRALAAPAPTDADAIAKSDAGPESVIGRLRTLGAAGRRAMLEYAGRRGPTRSLLDALSADTPRDAIEEASRDSASDETSQLRREGAAILARLLPAEDAVPILTRLAAREELRDSAAWSLVEVERGSPGSVPPALAASLCRNADRSPRWPGIWLAETVGPRVLAHDPSLLRDLRALRDGLDTAVAARAAVSLWRFTRDRDEAMPALRRVLARPELIVREDFPWKVVGSALSEIPLTEEDVTDVAISLKRAATLCGPRDRHEAPSEGELVEGALEWVVPALERCGAAAAPAVPALRLVVARDWSDGDFVACDVLAARALGAIGPRARDALPDLRRAVARSGEVSMAARAAIARIEAGR